MSWKRLIRQRLNTTNFERRRNGWFVSLSVSWWMCYQPSGSHPEIFYSGFQICLMVALFIMAENWVKSEVCVKWLRSGLNARRYLRTLMGCRGEVRGKVTKGPALTFKNEMDCKWNTTQLRWHCSLYLLGIVSVTLCMFRSIRWINEMAFKWDAGITLIHFEQWNVTYQSLWQRLNHHKFPVSCSPNKMAKVLTENELVMLCLCFSGRPLLILP